MTSPTLSLIQNIDIPLRTPSPSRSPAGADATDATFAQALKERSQRPEQADSAVDAPVATDTEPDAQIETTDSADEAQNEPVIVEDGDGYGEVGDVVKGDAEEKLDTDQSTKETLEQPLTVQADTPPAAPIEAVKPASPVNSATPLSGDEPSNPSNPSKTLSKPSQGLADERVALQPAAQDSSGATVVDSEETPALPNSQSVKIDTPSPATAVSAGDVSSADSTDVSAPVDPVKTPTAPATDAQDKPKVDPAQHAPTSSGEGPQSHAGGRVSAVEGAQSSPDSTFQEGQHRQAEPVLRTAGRNTLTQPEAEAPSANQRLFNATVSRGLEAAMRQKGGAITIRLKPDSLGSLRIELQISQGAVTAQFQATTQKARDLLYENMSSLRTSLEAKGFGVKSVDVQVQASSPGEHTSGEFGRSSEDAAGQTPTQDSGANGQSPSRQEDPDDFPYLNQTVDPFTEVEPVGTGWQTVRAGGVNTIA